MATANDKLICVKCKKPKSTVKCEGCAKHFCLVHMNEHHQQLSEQLSQTEDRYNQFKNAIEGRTSDSRRHPLIKQIDDWEKQSIEKIRQVADVVRSQVSSRIEPSTADLNSQLKRLTGQLSECRKEDDFSDKDVQLFNEELKQLEIRLDALPDCKLEYRSTPFISKIHLVDESGSLYVADSSNHRIMRWKKDATEEILVVGGNGRGNRANQLSEPTGLSLDLQGNLYVVDSGNSRVQKFSMNPS